MPNIPITSAPSMFKALAPASRSQPAAVRPILIQAARFKAAASRGSFRPIGPGAHAHKPANAPTQNATPAAMPAISAGS